MKSAELRKKFLEFFKKNGHAIVASSSLLPTDPSVLFTTAGMQQFKPYYLGEKSPWGLNVASCQKCIRTSDIEEVGDERHLTFFEMLGNFSFGGYWKKEAIELAYKFIVDELNLEIDYVTVFEGNKNVPFDEESYNIWKSLGIDEAKIKKAGMEDNFWGPTGDGGPCGPTTEIYVNPSPDGSGPAVEIWNIVFNEFFCDGSREQLLKGESKLTPLDIKGIDTGMGLERLAMVCQSVPTVFDTDLFDKFISILHNDIDFKKKRILADHIRAIGFMVQDGVCPSNKDAGYILRRLMRRVFAQHKMENIKLGIDWVCTKFEKIYELNNKNIEEVLNEEWKQFIVALDLGVKELNKLVNIDSATAFKLYSSYGLPLDVIKDKFSNFDIKKFEEEFKKHQELSRTASAGMFKGGLADDKPKTIKLHTAHHLLLATLQELFGKQVKQKGSNINSERLRFDFSFDRKLTDEEKKKIEDIVNDKISEGLEVVKKEMPIEEAKKIGAEMEFGVKYGNTVSVYFIQDKQGNIFSKEFCGGPHVENTNQLGKFNIIKEEASSQGVRRIKATLE